MVGHAGSRPTQENAYTKEEMKVTWETQKIFGTKETRGGAPAAAPRVPSPDRAGAWGSQAKV